MMAGAVLLPTAWAKWDRASSSAPGGTGRQYLPPPLARRHAIAAARYYVRRPGRHRVDLVHACMAGAPVLPGMASAAVVIGRISVVADVRRIPLALMLVFSRSRDMKRAGQFIAFTHGSWAAGQMLADYATLLDPVRNLRISVIVADGRPGFQPAGWTFSRSGQGTSGFVIPHRFGFFHIAANTAKAPLLVRGPSAVSAALYQSS